MIASSTRGDNPQLKAIISGAIAATPDRRITFEKFMELALYWPGEGYYTHRGGLIGVRGDFYTAPHLTSVFGELLARQIAEFWQRMGQPPDFEIVEVGAGQGLLAGDILNRLRQTEPALWPGLRYTIIEISEQLRLNQRRRLEAVPNGAELIDHLSWRLMDQLGPESVTGCFISNELLDAFPVHQVIVEEGQLREIYVTLDPDGEFSEDSGPLSTPALATYFEQLAIPVNTYVEGYRTEVNLGMLDWLAGVARSLKRGYVLTVDYGYPANQRYHPLRRDGSLQCYSAHQVHDNPYINLGRQDITSHVDFTSLIRRGTELGLREVGFTRQANFLGGLGIGDILASLSDPVYRLNAGLTTKQQLAEREALQRLINPTALGNFGVLIQSKEVPDTGLPLTGLSLKF